MVQEQVIKDPVKTPLTNEYSPQIFCLTALRSLAHTAKVLPAVN